MFQEKSVFLSQKHKFDMVSASERRCLTPLVQGILKKLLWICEFGCEENQIKETNQLVEEYL